MRLNILMIEVEQPEGLSTRKLVLETARHNVITAYTSAGGRKLLKRFPNVDAVVVHTELDNSSLKETVRGLKSIRKDLPVIAISPRDDCEKDGADYLISSHDPQALLALLAEEFEAATSEEGEQ